MTKLHWQPERREDMVMNLHRKQPPAKEWSVLRSCFMFPAPVSAVSSSPVLCTHFVWGCTFLLLAQIWSRKCHSANLSGSQSVDGWVYTDKSIRTVFFKRPCAMKAWILLNLCFLLLLFWSDKYVIIHFSIYIYSIWSCGLHATCCHCNCKQLRALFLLGLLYLWPYCFHLCGLYMSLSPASCLTRTAVPSECWRQSSLSVSCVFFIVGEALFPLTSKFQHIQSFRTSWTELHVMSYANGPLTQCVQYQEYVPVILLHFPQCYLFLL
jgi:hypothetical protein